MEENIKGSFFITHSWMYELGLHPTALRIYAVIYGFTEHGQSWYGSCTALAGYAGTTRRNVLRVLSSLEERGLIERIGVKRVGSGRPIVEYKALPPDCECDKMTRSM